MRCLRCLAVVLATVAVGCFVTEPRLPRRQKSIDSSRDSSASIATATPQVGSTGYLIPCACDRKGRSRMLRSERFWTSGTAGRVVHALERQAMYTGCAVATAG